MKLLTKRVFTYFDPKNKTEIDFSYSVGQPMGCYSS